MKTSNEQFDDRIVEVHWDPVGEHWRMMRFRSDKPNGNHKSVVDNIIKSIADGVEKDAVGVSPVSSYMARSDMVSTASRSLAVYPEQLEDASRAARRPASSSPKSTCPSTKTTTALAAATPARTSACGGPLRTARAVTLEQGHRAVHGRRDVQMTWLWLHGHGLAAVL